jgi:crotonobetainyl-CoA:carnitine CoA-transferase CaiB-like acyl-CoA transferase
MPDTTVEAAFDDLVTRVTGASAPPPLLSGERGSLPSRLPVEDAAAATVAIALTTAARLAAQTTGRTAPQVALDRDHLAAAFRSEAYVRVHGEPTGAGFAPLSRFWPAADGWVRTHANYEWHRAALLRALDIADSAGDPATVGQTIATMSAAAVEDAVTAENGIAAAVRTQAEWTLTPDNPLIGHATIGDAQARVARGSGLPAAAVRVLDLTRVIAGPVGTRFLAALGADVLRIDPPRLPELPSQIPDGLVGKRSAFLDAARDRQLLHKLLTGADVLVHGYRPGALAAFGLDAETLAERHPGLVVVELSAWGDTGPWARRRGFDSIVQAASGIAMIETPGDDRPGAMPCQLLDHGTGYLIAAAALDGLLRQRTSGGTHVRRLSLAATAEWLLRLPRPEKAAEPSALDVTPWLTTIGDLTAVRPPGTLDGTPLTWARGLPVYGGDSPAW